MAKVRIVLNSKGIKAIMRSERVAADMKRRVDAMAAAAGEGHETEVEIGRSRARAVVYTKTADAMKREATEKSLTRAIDAGRE